MPMYNDFDVPEDQAQHRKTIALTIGLVFLAIVVIAGAVFFTWRNHQQPTLDNPEMPNSELLSATAASGFEVTIMGRIAAPEGEDPAPWEKGALKVCPGDTVEIQTSYLNLDPSRHDGVCMGIYLPEGTEYIPGSTILYNFDSPDGISVDDTVVDYGINIGSYAGYEGLKTSTSSDERPHGANAYVRISVRIPELTTKISTPVETWFKAGMSGEEATVQFGELTLEVTPPSVN